MKPKVIFIINSIQQQRCIKRIEEFIANGYDVQAYGFSRAKEIPTLPTNFQINVIGQFGNDISYLKRMWLMVKALRPVFKRHAKENVIYYYFLLDIAIASRMLCRKPYIYEESDIMQTWMQSQFLCKMLNLLDRHIIKKSILTVMTSEGFAIYHYGDCHPENIVFIPNRLNKKILDLSYTPSSTDINHLHFAYVGWARSKAIVSFAKILAKYFPQHEFHLYGKIQDYMEEFEQIQESSNNIYIHGIFSNPDDLPIIYQHIDLVLATYDTLIDNERLLEPNKLYEAIYFQTPIIVSENTFLSQKVDELGIGFAINPYDPQNIISFIQDVTIDILNQKIKACSLIDQSYLIDDNSSFFSKLDIRLNNR